MTPYETAGIAASHIGLAMKRADDQRAAQAAEDRKVAQAMLAALQELIRRTAPPSSQDAPRPGPAEWRPVRAGVGAPACPGASLCPAAT